MTYQALFSRQETVEDVESYLKDNSNVSVWKTVQVLNLSKSLHRILKRFLKLHPFKILHYQFLTENTMAKRLDFFKTISRMFENGELDEKLIISSE